MIESDIAQIEQGLKAAFVDGKVSSNLAYKPQFVSNNYKEGRKVLSTVEEELRSCDAFFISVAFITEGGIAPLMQTLEELAERGVNGKILTTDYRVFTQPKALLRLAKFENIELKIYKVENEECSYGFHTKGYIFKRNGIYRILTGSSNLTLNALTKNKEWNTKIISTEDGDYTRHVVDEFDILWNSDKAKSYDEYFDDYAVLYSSVIRHQKEIARSQDIIPIEQYTLTPNKMQLAFIANLRKVLDENGSRALLISATGTGKTYASAFALRELGFKRALFLVHRTQITDQAKKSFANVCGKTIKMGLLGGGHNDVKCDYIFATVQTMSRNETLQQFNPAYFDVVVIDEAHHSGAQSYEKIMKYFKPRLYLGMTATPDKRDDRQGGMSIYELFNYEIACEIRLNDALENDLLCPFHYFGISDIEGVDDDISFSNLTSDERVKHVMEKAMLYGYSGERVKGLVFCRKIDEAWELSEKFNEHGWRTLVLTGSNTQEERQNAINRLTKSNGDDCLDYILSVDIFSEGVDIREINQVIMLRPTTSPIVFVQQLGRGLRKCDGKEFVVVLDFIGNYNNNFMIPIALSGDRSYNKDNIRRYVLEGERIIPGASTIHFDRVSKQKIFRAIDSKNFSEIKLLKENYLTLKDKLGRIPTLIDFDVYGEMDPLRFSDNSSLGSYYKFLVKHEPEFKIRLTDDEELLMRFISDKLSNGKRVYELILLKLLLTEYDELIEKMSGFVKEKYGLDITEEIVTSIVNVLTNEFAVGSGKDTYKKCVFIERDNDDYRATELVKNALKNQGFVSLYKDLINFGISRYERDYINRHKDTDLVLFKKYTYEDVCRLLNWKHNEVSTNIGGYKYNQDTNTFPVFINYEKDDDISATIAYRDRFDNSPSRLIAISKSQRRISSGDVQRFISCTRDAYECDKNSPPPKVFLFVRKNKNDNGSKEFYYLGQMYHNGFTKEFIMPGTDKSAVEIGWDLETPVREDIYEFFECEDKI